MLKFRLIVGIQILIIGALLLSACGATPADLSPTVTVNPNDIRTQAVQTFAADLTLTAFLAATNTPAATITPLATFTVGATNTGAALGTAPVVGATASCYGLSFVSDVTIPDNTPMNAGQAFTKTWKVKNAGSCAWMLDSSLDLPVASKWVGQHLRCHLLSRLVQCLISRFR